MPRRLPIQLSALPALTFETPTSTWTLLPSRTRDILLLSENGRLLNPAYAHLSPSHGGFIKRNPFMAAWQVFVRAHCPISRAHAIPAARAAACPVAKTQRWLCGDTAQLDVLPKRCAQSVSLRLIQLKKVLTLHDGLSVPASADKWVWIRLLNGAAA